jgi:hypothetical protein
MNAQANVRVWNMHIKLYAENLIVIDVQTSLRISLTIKPIK